MSLWSHVMGVELFGWTAYHQWTAYSHRLPFLSFLLISS